MIPYGTRAAKSGKDFRRGLEAIQSTSVQTILKRGHIVQDLCVYGRRGFIVRSEIRIAQDLISQRRFGYHVNSAKVRGGLVGRDVSGAICGGTDW